MWLTIQYLKLFSKTNTNFFSFRNANGTLETGSESTSLPTAKKFEYRAPEWIKPVAKEARLSAVTSSRRRPTSTTNSTMPEDDVRSKRKEKHEALERSTFSTQSSTDENPNLPKSVQLSPPSTTETNQAQNHPMAALFELLLTLHSLNRHCDMLISDATRELNAEVDSTLFHSDALKTPTLNDLIPKTSLYCNYFLASLKHIINAKQNELINIIEVDNFKAILDVPLEEVLQFEALLTPLTNMMTQCRLWG